MVGACWSSYFSLISSIHCIFENANSWVIKTLIYPQGPEAKVGSISGFKKKDCLPHSAFFSILPKTKYDFGKWAKD